MTADWVQKPLGEVVSLQRGHDLPTQKRVHGDVPIMGSAGITGWHNEVKMKAPGVVVGRSGNSMGEVHYCNTDYWPLNTCLFVTDFKGNDERYIYLLLNSINFDQFNSGSAQKSLNRNAVYPYEVILPESKDGQSKIANSVFDFTSKIELNRQINQTLESMAQAIFKSWFVDFEPVKAKISALKSGEDAEGVTRAAMRVISGKADDELDKMEGGQPEDYAKLKTTAELFPAAMQDSELGDVPEGWEVKPLDKIAHYQNGLALQKFRPENEDEYLPVLKIAQLKKGFADGVEKASVNIKPGCIVDNGDIVFSWSGSLMVDIWCGGKVALNQHLFKVTSEKYSKWFYYYWTKHHLSEFQRIASAKAVTMGHIKREHLSSAFCTTPDSQILENLSKTMECLVEKSIEVRLENVILQNLRDTLLPKLMSGEIRVKVNR